MARFGRHVSGKISLKLDGLLIDREIARQM